MKTKANKAMAVFLIVSLFIVTAYQLYYPNGTNSLSQGAGNDNPTGGEQLPRLLASDPLASPRPVNESAVGFDAGVGTGRTVNLPSSATNDLPVTLGYGWVGSKLYTTISGLWDKRQWVTGGGFDTGSGHTSGPWSYYERDPGNRDDGNWISGTPTPGQFVYAGLPHPGGTRTYYADEYSSWNETVTVPRGTVLDAQLSLRYYPTYSTSFARGEFLIFCKIEGHLVWYSDFKTVNDAGQLNKWNSLVNKTVLQDVNATNTFNLPSDQLVTISIGVWYHAAQADYTFSASQNRVYFDNVTLYIKAYARTEQIRLQVKPQSSGPTVDVSSSTYGSGSATITGFTIGPPSIQTTYYFDFTSNVSLPVTGSFTANATVYVTRQKTAVTSFVNMGSDVEWSISLATAFESNGQQYSTTTYTRYYFNISVPLDWNLTTCQDPVGYIHNIKTEANNFTIVTLGSGTILRLNVTRIGVYSTQPNLYPYVVHALTSNYVKSLFTQKQSGPSWLNVTNFYGNDVGKFCAYIKGASPMSGGMANLTITGPPTYNATPAIVKTITGVTPVNGFANFTITWVGSYAPGNYSAQVDWFYSSLGEAGSLTSEFNITHRFQLGIAVPGQGDVILKGQRIENPPTSVSVLDYDSNEFVIATVYGRASWESPGRWDHFTTYSAYNATYTNVTFVPASLTVGSAQWLAVNVSNGWYDPATVNNTFWIGTQANINPPTQNLNIYHTEAQSFSITVPRILYSQTNGSAIKAAQITLSAYISSNNSLVQWNSRFTANYTESDLGYYSGTINVGTFSSSVKAIPPGTYTIWFRFYKDQYTETKFSSFQLTMYPAPHEIHRWTGDGQYVFWGETARFEMNYTTQWGLSGYTLPTTAIRNDTGAPTYAPPYVRVSYCSWTGAWTASHLISEPDGTYSIYIDTSSFTTPTPTGSGAGTVLIGVRFSKDGYSGNSNLETLTLHIKSLATLLTGVGTNTTSAFSGDRTTVLVWYNDTHGIPSVGISGGTLAYTYRSGSGTFLGSAFLIPHPTTQGLYNLTLTSAMTDQLAGTFYLYVNASKDPYYVYRQTTITLIINNRTSSLTSYTLGTDGQQMPGLQREITRGDTLTIYLWYNDTHNGVPIIGGSTTVWYQSQEFGTGWATPVPGVDGLYTVTFTAPDAGDWSITFRASEPKYQLQTLVFRVIVRAPWTFGVFEMMLVGFGGGGSVLVAVVAWIFIRRSRIPFIVKKIDETLKLIGKGDHEAATPVPLKSREEVIVGITQDRIDLFTKKKPVALGKPEKGAAAAEVAPAPSPETTALKTELAAHEVEKPGEAIEDVEMETLDEQLQELERVESKEELPDGAKEARDVIDKYREGKKKKKD